jgi:bifunctional UDP-N-acetylglucosamine pyrophosphorylase/glucosamine-1-phosphate N-acetyltransferase
MGMLAASPRRAAVILAAGRGERMRSPVPKVLHRIAGRTMLDMAIDTAQALDCDPIVVVVGDHSPGVRAHAATRLGDEAVVLQDPPLGTGHAVLAARDALAGFEGDVLVTYADVPLLTAEAVAPLFDLRDAGADIAVLGFETAEPGAYGRLVIVGGFLESIVEAKDASVDQLAITACNSGVIVADASRLFGLLDRVTNNNAKGEYYLTDVVGLAKADSADVRAAFASEAVVAGVNSQAELAAAEGLWQTQRRSEMMSAGVTMNAPHTVHLAWDTAIAPGATIEPYVVFGADVSVASGAVIRAFSHLEGARVGEGALIGPYARLRPGADIGAAAHIGNFVEVKKVRVGVGAKANHLSYLGDGTVGAGANIGAGTIFCNYDGFDKHDTHVGDGAFVGSNSSLVAPVSIGAGAYTGSGSVITRDVAPDALVLERGTQTVKPGWAAAFRARKMRGRKPK